MSYELRVKSRKPNNKQRIRQWTDRQGTKNNKQGTKNKEQNRTKNKIKQKTK